MIPTPKVEKSPDIKRKSVRNWKQGTVTAFDDRRSPLEGLLSSDNMMLVQDNAITVRPGLRKYGPQPLGQVVGQLFEFIETTPTGNIFWLASLQHVSGKTNLYIAKGEDTTWSKVIGKDYDVVAPGHFLQIAGKVLVMNGEDSLSYLEISDKSLVTFTSLANPVAPTKKSQEGLSGTSYNTFYAISANSSVGKTKGSPVLQVDTGKDRDTWNPDTESITIQWTAVTGAKSYNVYMGIGVDGGGEPKLYQIATGIPSDQLEFTDNGSRAQNIQEPLPKDNSTSGPKATRGTVANGRVWLVGDRDNPFYLWRGGDFRNELDFSPAAGGGYTPVGSGTKEVPIAVEQYRSGQGDPRLTVLSKGSNGSGKRFLVSPAQVSLGSTTITVWEVVEDTGADGTDSPDGLIVYNNDLHYPSRDGFKTTGTQPQLQNVLSTRRTSNTIQRDISTLQTESMSKAVGLPYEGRLYWALPVNSDQNNQIWVLDIDRGGAWMKPWNIAASWIMLYNDNSGRTRFLVVTDSGIYEFSESIKTSDDGESFITGGSSGQILFEKTGREWARLLRVIFVLMRPQGEITMSVSGRTEDGVLPFNITERFGAVSTRAGWSEPVSGWSTRGWSQVKRVPASFNSPSKEVEIEVDEDMQWAKYSWSTRGAGVSYTISDVVLEYVNVGIKDLN